MPIRKTEQARPTCPSTPAKRAAERTESGGRSESDAKGPRDGLVRAEEGRHGASAAERVRTKLDALGIGGGRRPAVSFGGLGPFGSFAPVLVVPSASGDSRKRIEELSVRQKPLYDELERLTGTTKIDAALRSIRGEINGLQAKLHRVERDLKKIEKDTDWLERQKAVNDGKEVHPYTRDELNWKTGGILLTLAVNGRVTPLGIALGLIVDAGKSIYKYQTKKQAEATFRDLLKANRGNYAGLCRMSSALSRVIGDLREMRKTVKGLAREIGKLEEQQGKVWEARKKTPSGRKRRRSGRARKRAPARTKAPERKDRGTIKRVEQRIELRRSSRPVWTYDR